MLQKTRKIGKQILYSRKFVNYRSQNNEKCDTIKILESVPKESTRASRRFTVWIFHTLTLWVCVFDGNKWKLCHHFTQMKSRYLGFLLERLLRVPERGLLVTDRSEVKVGLNGFLGFVYTICLEMWVCYVFNNKVRSWTFHSHYSYCVSNCLSFRCSLD